MVLPAWVGSDVTGPVSDAGGGRENVLTREHKLKGYDVTLRQSKRKQKNCAHTFCYRCVWKCRERCGGHYGR